MTSNPSGPTANAVDNPRTLGGTTLSVAPSHRSPTNAVLLVAFMWFAYFLNYCDRQAVFSMFPSLKSDLNMSDQQLGLTGAAFLWVYAVGCPIAGILGDRWSKRFMVVLSLVLWSLITAATGLSRSGEILLSLRGAMGISEALFMPTAIALTANAFSPALRSRAISVLTTAQIAGTIVGSWFGGWMAHQGRWREAFFILGAVGLLYAVPYLLFLRRIDEAGFEVTEKKFRTSSIVPLFFVRSFLVLCIVFPVFVFGLWLLYGWFPTFLHDKFSLNQADAAFNAAMFLQGSTAIGLISGGFLADWLYRYSTASRMWLMVASLVFCAPCLHTLGNSDTLTATRVSAAAFGLFSGWLMGNIFPAAFEVVTSHSRASAVGILNFCGAMMSGFATLFGGMWKSTLGIDRLLTWTALGYVFAGLLLMVGIFAFFNADSQRT
jgi:MFS family permease